MWGDVSLTVQVQRLQLRQFAQSECQSQCALGANVADCDLQCTVQQVHTVRHMQSAITNWGGKLVRHSERGYSGDAQAVTQPLLKPQ